MESSITSEYASPSLHGLERKRSGRNSFLNKLRDILNNSSLKDVICWSGDGDRFDILNSKMLQEEVIPRYFKHKNMKSFVRQLNLHGFKKIRVGSRNPDLNGIESYRHTLFRRHQPDLLNFIKRKVSKPIESDDKSEQINYLLEQKRKLEEKCNKVKEDRDTDLLKIISDCQESEHGITLLNALKVYVRYPDIKKETDSSNTFVYSLTKEFIHNLTNLGNVLSSEDAKSHTSAPTAECESLGKRHDLPYSPHIESDRYNKEGACSPDFMSEESPFNLDYQDEGQCIASSEVQWNLITDGVAK
jgi:hypothetical protein